MTAALIVAAVLIVLSASSPARSANARSPGAKQPPPITAVVAGTESEAAMVRRPITITATYDIAPVGETCEKVAKQTGYRILHHRHDFFGVCPDCLGDSEHRDEAHVGATAQQRLAP